MASDNGLELSGLSNHLWGAVNILRGPVDAVDSKTNIRPVLFFKRVAGWQESSQSLRASMTELFGSLRRDTNA